MVASDPFADPDPTSRTVAGDRGGDGVPRLDERLGSLTSSAILVLEDFLLATRPGVSFSLSLLNSLDFGVSGLAVLLDLDASSFFERKLEDDLVDSARIRIFVFGSLGFSFFSSAAFSSLSPTVLPLREDP